MILGGLLAARYVAEHVAEPLVAGVLSVAAEIVRGNRKGERP